MLSGWDTLLVGSGLGLCVGLGIHRLRVRSLLKQLVGALWANETMLPERIDERLIVQRANELQTSQNTLSELLRNHDGMVANFAHDIRTPLTSVQGCLEAFLRAEGSRNDAEREALVAQALSGVERTTVLIKRLLELCRLEAGQQFSADDVRLDEIASNLVAQFRASAEAKVVSLLLEVTPVPAVPGDSVAIERATANIIAKAIRYTGPGGTVVVSVRRDPRGVALEVSDTGIGIPKEDIPSVGTRFFRVQRDRSRETGGTGLGLAITRQILKLHHADLEIVSEIGKGTSIRFVLGSYRQVDRTTSVQTEVST